MKGIYTIIVALLLISLASATTCNPSFVLVDYNQGEELKQTITCTNPGNETITITKSGGFTINKVQILDSATEEIEIDFDENAPIGFNSGKIQFSDGLDLMVFSEVSEPLPTGCTIDIFPSILTNIRVEQGEMKTRNVQVNVPLCYESAVSVNGVALQTDERPIQLGELSIGTIQPGNSVVVPIELDAKDISTGQYSDTLQLLLYDNLGNRITIPTVSISVLVTAGIQPITNFSLTELPSCSLDSLDLNLNNTYKLTCTRNNPNIEIRPVIDSFYLKGVKVEETSTQYIYYFKGHKIGNTEMKVEFLYKNAVIGDIYSQEMRITPSGNSPIPGTILDFAFYQGSQGKGINDLGPGETRILVLDNGTRNIVNNHNLYLNGESTNSTISLASNTEYELRASSPGYLDRVMTIRAKSVPIVITVSPLKSFYYVGEKINITDSVNSTYLMNNIIITSPYTFTKAGNKTLKASKEGYVSSSKNITVLERVSLGVCSPETQDWRVGKKTKCELSKNSSWEILLEGNVIASGESIEIEFEAEEEGYLEIKSQGISIYGKTVEKKSMLKRGYNHFKENWILWILSIAIAGTLFYYFFIRDTGEEPLLNKYEEE